MTNGTANRTAPSGTAPAPAIGSPIRRILVARGLRDFGDGLAAVLLPAYLGSGHESALSVRLVRTEGQLRSEAA